MEGRRRAGKGSTLRLLPSAAATASAHWAISPWLRRSTFAGAPSRLAAAAALVPAMTGDGISSGLAVFLAVAAVAVVAAGVAVTLALDARLACTSAPSGNKASAATEGSGASAAATGTGAGGGAAAAVELFDLTVAGGVDETVDLPLAGLNLDDDLI